MKQTDQKLILQQRIKEIDKAIAAIKGVSFAELHQINNLNNKRASVKSRIDNTKYYTNGDDSGYRHYTIDRRLI